MRFLFLKFTIDFRFSAAVQADRDKFDLCLRLRNCERCIKLMPVPRGLRRGSAAARLLE